MKQGEDRTLDNMATQIIVIDDEEDIRELLEYNLSREGYRVALHAEGNNALKAIRAIKPDLIILDLMLPGLHGLDVCRIVKNDEQLEDIPIIMLTARGEEEDIVTGLELGADDYITKPFSMHVLLARIKAVMRRSEKAAQRDFTRVISVGGLKIDPDYYQVTLNDREIKLTPTEFGVLKTLVENEGKVFTRNQLLNTVQDGSVYVIDRTIDVHLTSLRKKLKEMGQNIETVRGVGYRFKAKNEQE
ncbi:MAG: response regulator [Spirochaetota bacterium]